MNMSTVQHSQMILQHRSMSHFFLLSRLRLTLLLSPGSRLIFTGRQQLEAELNTVEDEDDKIPEPV